MTNAVRSTDTKKIYIYKKLGRGPYGQRYMFCQSAEILQKALEIQEL